METLKASTLQSFVITKPLTKKLFLLLLYMFEINIERHYAFVNTFFPADSLQNLNNSNEAPPPLQRSPLDKRREIRPVKKLNPRVNIEMQGSVIN